jgi:D-glycero-beta-D-manno-heptose 1-phosphate adenylyltransferase
VNLSLEDKIVSPERIEEKVKELKKQGKKIVTLNGSFDLLHAGHLYIIQEAAKQGDILIVALNSDDSIKSYKSKKRPIIPLKDRLKMMAALQCVNLVTFFEQTDPSDILSKIKPDIHANGEEYGQHCIEAKTIRSFGGKLHLIQRIDGLSTSDIIQKIKES